MRLAHDVSGSIFGLGTSLLSYPRTIGIATTNKEAPALSMEHTIHHAENEPMT